MQWLVKYSMVEDLNMLFSKHKYLTECIASIDSSHLKKFGVQSSPTLSLSALASLWICIRNIVIPNLIM